MNWPRSRRPPLRAPRVEGGPLLVRRKDGLLEIQVKMSEFQQRWATSTREDQLVLDGQPRRPALWTDRAARTVLAPFPANWEDWRRRQRRGEPGATSRERTCAQCGAVMKLSKELEDAWTFFCPTCRSALILTKGMYGGTIGAGEKESS